MSVTKLGPGGITIANANPTAPGLVDYGFIGGAGSPPPPPYTNTNSVLLNGTTNKYNVPYSAIGELDSLTPWAMEFWFKWTNAAALFRNLYTTIAGGKGIAIQPHLGTLRIILVNGVGGVIGVQTGGVYSSGVWVHTRINYDGGRSVTSFTVAINGSNVAVGTLVGTTLSGDTANGTQGPVIGADTPGGAANNFNGNIQRITVYNGIQLSASDTTALAVAPTISAATLGSWSSAILGLNCGNDDDTASLLTDLKNGNDAVGDTDGTIVADAPP